MSNTHTTDTFDSRTDRREEIISELEDRILPNLNNREGKTKNEQSLNDLRDYNKRSNIHVIRVLEGEKKRV